MVVTDLSHWCGELIHKKQNYQTVIMRQPMYIMIAFGKRLQYLEAHFANNCPPKVSINTLKHLAAKAEEI